CSGNLLILSCPYVVTVRHVNQRSLLPGSPIQFNPPDGGGLPACPDFRRGTGLRSHRAPARCRREFPRDSAVVRCESTLRAARRPRRSDARSPRSEIPASALPCSAGGVRHEDLGAKGPSLQPTPCHR